MIAPPRAALLLSSALALACSREEPASAPPPLPQVAASELSAPAVVVAPHPAPPIAPTVKSAKKAAREAPATKAREPAPAVRKPSPTVQPASEPPRVVAPPPAPPAPAPAAPLKKRVNVPRTEHVHVEFPAGLQADLDADPRMQSWIDRVIAVADDCHARSRAATGTIEVQITMHENERPSADVRALPGQLSGVVACATGALMRVKMPLFTGREGTRYTARIVFQ